MNSTILSSPLGKRMRKLTGILFGLILITCPFNLAFGGDIAVWGDSVFTQNPADAGSDFVDIDAGSVYGVGLRADGTIEAWDDYSLYMQSYSSLGNDFKAVAAGGGFGLALRADGSIIGWGLDYYGQAQPPAGNDFVAIAAGEFHGLALRKDGSIACWGNGFLGQADPPAGNDYVAIAGGRWHSLALRADGSLVVWGFDDYGLLEPPAGNDFVAVDAGDFHCLALRADGKIEAWGNNDYGQATPPAGNDFIAISAGAFHNLALRADGSLVAWGDDLYGETIVPEGGGFVDIAAGDGFSMALKSSSLLAPATPPVLTVSIDIKPWAYPNSINLKAMGVLPVAIFGSESFDAATVDPNTVTLSEAGIMAVGKKQKRMAYLADLNRDGYKDLLCLFDIRQLSLNPDATTAVLIGSTYGGTAIAGEDTVNIVQPKRPTWFKNAKTSFKKPMPSKKGK